MSKIEEDAEAVAKASLEKRKVLLKEDKVETNGSQGQDFNPKILKRRKRQSPSATTIFKPQIIIQ